MSKINHNKKSSIIIPRILAILEKLTNFTKALKVIFDNKLPKNKFSEKYKNNDRGQHSR